MTRFFVQPDDVFNVFKQRATITVDKHLDVIDEDIRRVIIELNGLDGVAPIWSCASHPETKRTSDRKMHVICAVNEKGVEQLDKVYQEWTTILMDYGLFHLPCLNIVRLVYPNVANRPILTAEDLYYAVELKVEHIKTKKLKRAMLISLEEAIRNVSF